MRNSCCFRSEKRKKQKGNRPKSEKKYAKMSEAPFGQYFILFGCTNLSYNSATSALDLLGHPAYWLLLPFPLLLLKIAAVTLGVGRFGVILEQQLK
jgi:hypothetical protein